MKTETGSKKPLAISPSRVGFLVVCCAFGSATIPINSYFSTGNIEFVEWIISGAAFLVAISTVGIVLLILKKKKYNKANN